MLQTLAMQTIDWLGLRLRVPGEWAMVRHSAKVDRGRLAFVDRRRERLLAYWSACPGEPDWDRMFSDHESLERQAHPGARFIRASDWFGWQVLQRRCEDEDLLRAARYDRPRNRVIELVAPVHEGQREVIDGVLADTELAAGADDRAARRFAAFDLRVTPPEGWALRDVSARVGEVAATFDAGRDALTVRRLGMADVWFHGDVHKALTQRLLDPRARFSVDRGTGRRGTTCRSDSLEKGPRIKRFAGRLRRRTDWLWHVPAANAVMHVTLLQGRGEPVELDAFDIDCLDALAGEA